MKRRKRSKLFLLLLSCLMVMALLPSAAFAAGEAATPQNGIKITKETTQEALDNWAGVEGAIEIKTEGDTTIVTLLKDFKLGKLGDNPSKANTPINFGDGSGEEAYDDKMILDLNGHLLESDTMVINSNCDLTIKDSVGTGKVFMDTSDSDTSAFEAVVNQSKLTIEGGSFEAKIHSSYSTTGVIGSAVANVETVINGGTFIGSGSAINVSSGTTTINGGTFEGGSYGIVAKKTAVVNLPSDSTAEVTSPKFPIVVGKSGDSTGKVNISGGTFNGTETTSLVGRLGEVDAKQAVTIDGGSFTQNPSDYTGSESVAQVEEGQFIVGEASIIKAAKNLESGDTINVIKGDVSLTDVPDGVTVENNGNGTVSVNGVDVKPSESQTVHTHVWGEPVFTWSADNKTCTVQRVCTKDNSHIETAAAAVTSAVKTPATCTQKGVTTYTATVTFDGKEYTDTKDVEDIPMLAHTYKDGKCTVCGTTDPDYDTGVATGDSSNMILWLAMLMVSGAGMLATAVYGKRRKYSK